MQAVRISIIPAFVAALLLAGCTTPSMETTPGGGPDTSEGDGFSTDGDDGDAAVDGEVAVDGDGDQFLTEGDQETVPAEDDDETDDETDIPGDADSEVDEDPNENEEGSLACVSADQCDAGLGCRAGFCGLCLGGEECRAGEGCAAGVCGACAAVEDCPAGRLCEAGNCLDCAADVACQEAYGAEFECEFGRCVNKTCLSVAECLIWGELCVEHRCAPCAGNYDCLESEGYGTGFQCLAGVCSNGDCEEDFQCPGDAPVCGADQHCRECRATLDGPHEECLARFGPGFLCSPSGVCLEGECLETPDCSTVNRGICNMTAAPDGDAGQDEAAFSCRPCLDVDEDVLCRDEYGLDDLICSGGACAAGCAPDSWSDAGEVCGDDLRFHDCAGDLECSIAHGDGICENGRCRVGCSAPALNLDGLVCGADHRWHACFRDGDCVQASGNDSAICKAGVCEVGCTLNAECPNQGVCDGHRCRACVESPGLPVDDCRSGGYGAGILCVAGRCVSAACNEVVRCADGRACLNNACVDCTTDNYSYCAAQGKVCDDAAHVCVQCNDRRDCSAGARICENKVCRDCLMGECSSGMVCAQGSCVIGACWIDGRAWAWGEKKPDNPCSQCNPFAGPYTWSANPGVNCDDRQSCTYNDQCSPLYPGICQGVPYDCDGNTCADGVCHGTGPGDCTLVKKASWQGCFIDGACYQHNQEDPADSCRLCNAGTGGWLGKPTGTRCGACRVCQGAPSSCSFVAESLDPNNDCIQNCEVCNGWGGCSWAAAGADPNNDCALAAPLTCGRNGLCEGGSNQCAYWSAEVQGVNDENPCTVNDRCDGLGGKTGDPLPAGTMCLGDLKVCRGGTCSDCYNSGECPNGRVCENGSCIFGVCTDAAQCGEAPPCRRFACVENQCVLQALSEGYCDDGNACTLSDYCVAGVCSPGESVQCSYLDGQCVYGQCDRSDGNCIQLARENGSTCNDGDSCTSGDSCLEGECVPAEPKCGDDGLSCTADCIDGACVWQVLSGKCVIEGRCWNHGDENPNNTCVECRTNIDQYGWTMDDDNACDVDGFACTTQACRSGVCVPDETFDELCDDGVSCTDDACGATAGCLHTPNPEHCDDGVACTLNACDIRADCVFTPDDGRCDDGILCTENVCDLSAGCVFVENDHNCDDEVPCTVDACDDAVGCVFTPDDGRCDDGVNCTVDVCSPQYDCLFTPDNGRCDDQVECTDNLCDPQAGCGFPISADRCRIDGVCRLAGDVNLDNPCTECKPASTNTSWTADDANDCVDGLACTLNETCSAGACNKDVAEGSCNIGQSCLADADPHPTNQCYYCDAALNPTDWTMGHDCDDADSESFEDRCVPVRDCIGRVRNYDWGFAAGLAGSYCESSGNGVAVAPDGSVYFVGKVEGPESDFDPGPGTLYSPSTSGSAYVAKFQADVVHAWTKFLPAGTEAIAVAVSLSDGSIYFTGGFKGTNLDFDPGEGQALFTSANWGAFLSHWSALGEHLWTWAKPGTGSSTIYNYQGYGVGVLSDGSAIVTGYYGYYKQSTNTRYTQAAVWKISSDGGMQTELKYGSANNNCGIYGTAVAVGPNDEVYVGGNSGYCGTSICGTATGANDGFLVKYTSGLGCLWAKSAADQDVDDSLAADSAGDPVWGHGGVIEKLNSADGGTIWSDSVWATRPYAVGVDPDGGIWRAGSFWGTLDFDSGPGVDSRTSAGSYDAFISHYTADGEYLWTWTFGGAAAENVYGIAVGSDWKIHLTGDFAGSSVDFDPTSGVDAFNAAEGEYCTSIFYWNMEYPLEE